VLDLVIRVGLIGQGFVATTLAVGLERIKRGEIPPYGVPFQDLLSYRINDIEIVVSHDIDEEKVDKSLYEVAKKYFSTLDIPESLSTIRVCRGIHLNSVKDLPIRARGLEDFMSLERAIEKIVSDWEKVHVDVIINLITTEHTKPLTSFKELETKIHNNEVNNLPATYAYFYAAALYANTVKPLVFVNAIPAIVAKNTALVSKAIESRILVVGDDGASGATPLTSDLLEHLAERNRYVRSIVQFNIGGNMDFLSLMNPTRNIAKETTKSSIVEDILGYNAPHFIKPTGYVETLGDKKFVSMHIEYISFNEAIDEIVINMRINDSPALAGLLVDVIRIGKIALDNEEYGTIYPINAFFMKNPGPREGKSISRIVAYQLLIDWLLKHRALKKVPRYSVYTLEKV